MHSEKNVDSLFYLMIIIAEMKDVIPVSTIVLAFLVFQICIAQVESYHFKCPLQANWKMRAEVTCNGISKYFCLYNNIDRTYVEGCNGPDWDRKGSKRIFSGSFTRGNCSQNRYQPFNFQTNESMSDCIYAKSICSEEGQIVNKDDLSQKDRTCYCDHTKNFSFINPPRNPCYCIPTEEDCSCYSRLSGVGYTDYDCIQSGYQENSRYKDNNKRNETTVEEKQPVNSYSFWFHTPLELELKSRLTATVVFGPCLILIIVWVFLAVVFDKMSSNKLHCLKILFHRRNSDDIKFRRMIHLLFRVACPVVRMKFNNAIKPNQLREKLDENRSEMETQYRKNETIIDDNQWDLLYDSNKGNEVKSEDFDIGLMMYLLRTLAKIKIDKEYPEPSVKSDNAMLSKIEYIRKEATQRFVADLPIDQFNHYWEDIIEAVLTLVSTLNIENDTDLTRLIDNIKCMQKNKNGYLRYRDYKMADLSSEENNFLVVCYALAKIVYPVIKKEFYIEFPEYLNSVDASEKQQTENKNVDVIYSEPDISCIQELKVICLSKRKKPKNLNLNLMLCKLKLKAEEENKKDYTEQLCVISDIHSNIVQSSNGVLSDTSLENILECMKQAVLHFGGTWKEKELMCLRKNKIL